MQLKQQYKYVIVGGGFFGAYLAHLLKERDGDANVVVIERENELMRRASFNNQARIHNGYHYPRCILTALSSRVNFSRFITEFEGCVVNNFQNYYAIGKIQSKVNARQFKTYVNLIGSPLEDAPDYIKSLFNPVFVEDVFLVREYAFDAGKLAKILFEKLYSDKIQLLFNTEVLKVCKSPEDKGITIKAFDRGSGKTVSISGEYVFICTYSNINTILSKSGILKIPLKEEMTEMALVKVPDILKDKSVTMMCGPFFSFMPFPPRGVHTLSHVRYTPHYNWYDTESSINNQEHYDECAGSLKSNYVKMIKDVSRYMPLASEFKYCGSIWEIKTILPRSENNDGRPILFKKDVGGIKNLICIMGGKLNNIYDLDDELDTLQNEQETKHRIPNL
jgi:glycine/D-amino acid oxidase-like deaminating enzyme